MDDPSHFGRLLIAVGLAIAGLGALMVFGIRLPGDIVVRRDNFTFYFPLGLSVVLSILLTLFFFIFGRK